VRGFDWLVVCIESVAHSVAEELLSESQSDRSDKVIGVDHSDLSEQNSV